MDPDAPDRYGRSFADVYDDWYVDAFDTAGAVATLTELADGGTILELGVGTGRLAVPLAQGGLRVIGVDASTEMLERVPPTDGLRCVLGDMRSVDVPVRALDAQIEFALAFCAFNTILNLANVDAVTDCLRSTRTLLRDGGRLVLEGFVPAEFDEIPASSLSPARIDSPDPVFVETTFDRSSGVLHGRHLQVLPESVQSRPWSVIVLGPAELTDLAIGVGFTVEHLWSDWRRSPFDEHSSSFVLVLRTLGS